MGTENVGDVHVSKLIQYGFFLLSLSAASFVVKINVDQYYFRQKVVLVLMNNPSWGKICAFKWIVVQLKLNRTIQLLSSFEKRLSHASFFILYQTY